MFTLARAGEIVALTRSGAIVRAENCRIDSIEDVFDGTDVVNAHAIIEIFARQFECARMRFGGLPFGMQ